LTHIFFQIHFRREAHKVRDLNRGSEQGERWPPPLPAVDQRRPVTPRDTQAREALVRRG
jgi:hypothetical protein